MVKIARPREDRRAPNPLHATIATGATLFRIFDPTSHGATPLGFRFWGPNHRFDHHLGLGPPDYAPADDPTRGVYYAASNFSGCVVEVFGDDASISLGQKCIAAPRVARDLFLLDLRGSGAMRAGSVAALAKVADRSLSQAWARHFYEHPEIYGAIDGVTYDNAHNDEDALVLFERAEGALTCPPDRVLRLDDAALRPALEDVALRNNLTFL